MADSEKSGITDTHVEGFLSALRLRKQLSEHSQRPLGRQDVTVQTKLKEIDAYIEVFLKSLAGSKPRFMVTSHSADGDEPTKVLLEFCDHIQFYESLKLSLSAGGIFVKTETLLPMDTVLDIEVVLQDSGTRFRTAGKVIWVNPREAQGRPAGLGIKFTRLNAIQRQILEDFMNGEIEPPGLSHLSEQA